jgi:hypothetical protein
MVLRSHRGVLRRAPPCKSLHWPGPDATFELLSKLPPALGSCFVSPSMRTLTNVKSSPNTRKLAQMVSTADFPRSRCWPSFLSVPLTGGLCLSGKRSYLCRWDGHRGMAGWER